MDFGAAARTDELVANSGERLKVDITRKFPEGFAGHGKF